MKSVVPKSPLGSEFDDFLFTPLGEDRNGLTLSVVSLLGRMNLDPWQEAGQLVALSPEAARKRLGLALDTLTDPLLRLANTEATIRRLLALLPRRVPATVQAPVAGAGALTAPDPRSRLRTIFFVTSAILLVGSQLLSLRRNAPPQPGATAGATLPAVPAPTPSIPPGH